MKRNKNRRESWGGVGEAGTGLERGIERSRRFRFQSRTGFAALEGIILCTSDVLLHRMV